MYKLLRSSAARRTAAGPAPGRATALLHGSAADEHFTTAELKVNYLRPAAGASFVCESEVVRRGRGLIYVESSLRDEQGRLVARASSSLVRVEGRVPSDGADPAK